MTYTLDIVKHTGNPEDPKFEEDFCFAVESFMNDPLRDGKIREVKFQRNLYYQNVDTVANPDCIDDVPKKKLVADYIAFVLWECSPSKCYESSSSEY